LSSTQNCGPVRFSGHQSFALRSTWLTKGVQACIRDSAIFRRENALVTLGVGKNMVQAIKYWCLACGMLEPHESKRFELQPTHLGRCLFDPDAGWDPYIEDRATAWLLHWKLATNKEYATTFFLTYNAFPRIEFSRTELVDWLDQRARELGKTVPTDTMRRDATVWIRSYLADDGPSTSAVEDMFDCPFADLGLLRKSPTGNLVAFVRGPKPSLPDGVFAFAVASYAAGRHQQAFLVSELASHVGSPGRVFQLNEEALIRRLGGIKEITDDAWAVDETAGRMQMLQRRNVDTHTLLAHYYTHQGTEGSL